MAVAVENEDTEFVVKMLRRLIPIKSISPSSGGEGEGAKADELCNILKEMGFENYNRYDTTDSSGKKRSSIVLKIGKMDKTLWLVSHIDTVPEGSPELWTRPPFTATVEGNRVYGRGAADNGEGIISSLLIIKHLDQSRMKYNLGLVFVADEETGSEYGISHLLSKNIFSDRDLVVVPDSGTPDGLLIEIAEKSILWLQFTFEGKQGHASRPDLALNATSNAMAFLTALDQQLHSSFSDSDETFEYPKSTFAITKHDKNVENINTIPGKDVFYMDCRVLPKYDLDLLMDFIKEKATEFTNTTGIKVNIKPVQKEQAPHPTSTNSEVYKILNQTIMKILGKEGKPIGIGGGTCAAFFRRKGINAVVWGISAPESYHKPDEFVVIDYILKAAEVEENMLYD